MSIAEQVTQLKTDFDDVYEAGKQEMLVAMWDDIQVKGARTDYRYAFAYMNGDNFYPNYDIKPRGINSSSNMFYGFHNSSSDNPINLVERLDARGFKIDLSELSGTWQLPFGYAKVSEIGTLDVSHLTLDRCFMNAANLTKIVKIIVSEKNTFVNQYGSIFNGCNSLKDIEFEGVIANDITFPNSPLSKASIENIVFVLSDDITDKTITFNEVAVNEAFTTDEWNTLMESKPNWSFALV